MERKKRLKEPMIDVGRYWTDSEWVKRWIQGGWIRNRHKMAGC